MWWEISQESRQKLETNALASQDLLEECPLPYRDDVVNKTVRNKYHMKRVPGKLTTAIGPTVSCSIANI